MTSIFIVIVFVVLIFVNAVPFWDISLFTALILFFVSCFCPFIFIRLSVIG
jgi:hypothetical protein